MPSTVQARPGQRKVATGQACDRTGGRFTPCPCFVPMPLGAAPGPSPGPPGLCLWQATSVIPASGRVARAFGRAATHDIACSLTAFALISRCDARPRPGSSAAPGAAPAPSPSRPGPRARDPAHPCCSLSVCPVPFFALCYAPQLSLLLASLCAHRNPDCTSWLPALCLTTCLLTFLSFLPHSESPFCAPALSVRRRD